MSTPERLIAWPAKSMYQGVSLAGGSPDTMVEYVRDDLCAPQDERVQALEAENARLRRAADVAATIANGALDPTAREATLRRDLSRVRDYLRAALRDMKGGE